MKVDQQYAEDIIKGLWHYLEEHQIVLDMVKFIIIFNEVMTIAMRFEI